MSDEVENTPQSMDCRPVCVEQVGGAAAEGAGHRRTRVQRLEDALAGISGVPRPSHKEFRESVAFVDKWRRNAGHGGVSSSSDGVRLVVDVAGSHG
jgi:hypothetical protein